MIKLESKVTEGVLAADIDSRPAAARMFSEIHCTFIEKLSAADNILVADFEVVRPEGDFTREDLKGLSVLSSWIKDELLKSTSADGVLININLVD